MRSPKRPFAWPCSPRRATCTGPRCGWVSPTARCSCGVRRNGLPAERRGAGNQAKEVAAEYQRLIRGWESEREHLGELYARMQPRAVRPEQDLLRPGALHRLFQQIESADRRGVRVDVA